MPERMDIFNATAGYVFGRLYEDFPTSVAIYIDDVVPEVRAILQVDDVDKNIIADAIHWLKDNEFIRRVRTVTRQKESSLRQGGEIYSLTDKGLTALQRTPSSLGPSLGDQLKSYLSETGKEVGTQALGNVVSQVIGGIFRFGLA